MARRFVLAPVLDAVSYPRRHIRWKIIAPYVIMAAVLAAAGTFLVTRLVTGSLEERFENQLAESARVASDAVVRRERSHLETVRAVTYTEGFPQALDTRNEWDLARLSLPLMANNQVQRLEVLDTSGQRVYGTQLVDESRLEYAGIFELADRSEWPLVQNVVQGRSDNEGDKFAQIIGTPQGYALYTAGPVYDGDRLVGVVLIASMLDSFLSAAKAEALADITIYGFDGTVLASTFTDAGSEDVDLTPVASALEEDPATAVRENKTLYGRDFDLLYGELRIRNEIVGVYSVGLPSSFIVSAGTTTRWQMGILFAVAMAAVLVIGWFTARNLTNPLLRLVKTARKVSSGDLTARSQVNSIDEVGVLASSFDSMTERVQHQHLQTIRALTSAIDARDPYTLGHSVRVGQLAMMLGESFGTPESDLQHLEIGGYLHDIGKIGVRDNVLLKPDVLTAEERAMIEMHPRIGLDILAPVDLAPEVIQFVAGHHEKLDGSGYPYGKSRTEISMIARIASVADIYDALTTDRPYRAAMAPEDAMKVLRREVEQGALDRRVVFAMDGLIERWEERRREDPQLKGYSIPGWPLAQAA
jgi:putative nucleotidyltransferase with HDIG domain